MKANTRLFTVAIIALVLASAFFAERRATGSSDIAPVAAPVASCTPPPSGMISWWSAESNTNNVAKDIQGSNNGVFENGATLASGEVGQAFSFSNGTTDRVRVPDNPSLHPRNITLTAWVNPTADRSFHKIISKPLNNGSWNPPYITYLLEMKSNEHPNMAADINGNFVECTSPDAVLLNTFSHLAGSYDGTDLKIYVDGVLKNTCNAPGSLTYGAATDLVIGANSSTAALNEGTVGLIDEAQIFDHALSNTDIADIHNAGSAGTCQTPSVSISDTSVSPGNSGTTDATFTVTVTRADGNPISVNYTTADGTGPDAAFAGTDYVFASGTLNFAANETTKTFPVTVNGRTRTSTKKFTVTLSSPTNALINRSPGTCTILTGNASADFSTTNNPNGTWSYGYATAITAGSVLTLYDKEQTCCGGGDLWSAFSIGIDPNVIHNPGPGDLTPGNFVLPADMLSLHPGGAQYSAVRWTAPQTGTYVLRGRFQGIDTTGPSTDVHIIQNLSSTATHLLNDSTCAGAPGACIGHVVEVPFVKELSVTAGDTIDFVVGANGSASSDTTALKAEFTPGSLTCTSPPSGMISWWPGDADAKDFTSSHNNGTLQGGATAGIAVGEVGKAFNLNGAGDFVRVTGKSSLQPANITLDAWVNPQGGGGFQHIVGKDYRGDGSWNSPWHSYSLTLHDLHPAVEITINGNYNNCESPDLAPAGSFTHIAGTYDGSAIKIYQNGALKNTCSVSGSIDYGTGTTDLTIGTRSPYSVGEGFPGVIDEVELFDHALQPSEIASIFNAGSAGKCKTYTTGFSSVSGSGTYGDTATLTATLLGNGSPLIGKSVTFTLNNTQYNANTDQQGVATVTGVSLMNVNAGTYSNAVTVSFAGDGTYTSSNGTGDLAVSKATPTITWSDPTDIVYGTSLSATQLNASASVTGASVNPFVYTPASGTVLHAGNSQALHVDFTPQDTTNYNNASKDVHINVTKATITITADDKQKTYRAANPTLTFTPSGFVNGDTAAILTGAPTITTTATATSVVNTYPITITKNTLSAVHNSFDDYGLSFVNGTLTVNKATPVINWSNPADITYGTALGGTQLNATVTNPNDGSTVGAGVPTNYSPASGTVLHAGNNQSLTANFTPSGGDAANYNNAAQKIVSINVLKKALTVTAENKGRPFNTANPPLTYTVSGFVNGDDATVLNRTQPNLSTTATQSSPVGDYPVTITVGTLSAADYSFTLVAGTLSVGKTVPVVNWSNPAPIVYGTAVTRAVQLNATATDPNTNASVNGTFTYPQENAVLHVGNSQTLTATFAPTDTTNYSAPSAKTVTINVTKATLTITADNKAKTYLANNPALTYTPSGFVNGDTASVLSGAPNLSTTATQASTVNGYAISAALGTLSAADYNFNFARGTLTVNKATPVVNWSNPADIVYGTGLSATQLNAAATNPNDGSTVTAGGTSSYNPAATTVLNAGNNQVLAFNFIPADTTNYNTPAQKTVSINVLKAEQTIGFGTLANRVFGDPPFTISATPGASGVPVTFSIVSGPATISGSTVTLTAPGSVTVRASESGNNNYNAAPSVNQSFLVTSAPGLTPITGRFVFSMADQNLPGHTIITSTNSDGTAVRQLLRDGGSPAWSPDGTKVVFVNGQTGRLSVVNADGSNVSDLGTHGGNIAFDSNPAWSPDGQSIAWDCGAESAICIRRANDPYAVTTAVNPPTHCGTMGKPAWSPDSKKIVFANNDCSVNTGPGFLWIYDLAAKSTTKLARSIQSFPVFYTAPTWSPDGTKILYTDYPGIRVINADGLSNPRDITIGFELSAHWSLDGKQIAFIDQDPNDSTKRYIMVMDADGSNRKRVYGPIQTDSFDWQLAPINVTTPTGAGASVSDGPVTLSFTNVSSGGTTSVIPITPQSAGSLPGGFAIDGNSLAFDVTTTASYTAPIEVCFNVPPVTGETAAQFIARRVMHGEGGTLVDRTSRHDFAAHLICANVNSLSPFAITTSLNPSTTNEIDNSTRFVQQHYLDFLERQPDTAGLNFWSSGINACGANASCTEVSRINTSAAFFLSIEFQHEGYLVERTYKSAYGDANGNSTIGGAHQLPVPLVRFNQFIADAAEVGQGVIVNQGNWQQQLDANKDAFMLDFVQRQGFLDAYPTTLTSAEFVNKLFANAGVTPSANDLATATGRFGSAADSSSITARAKALRDVAENAAFVQAEMNRAFVLMEYFGYLRRNPNEGQDPDYTGYDFWLRKLNQFNGDFVRAEMVKAFISSTEYRQRFGPQ